MKLRTKFLTAAACVGVFSLSTWGTYALWEDDETTTGSIATGQVLFQVGTPTTVVEAATGTDATVEFPLTSAHADTLVAAGEVAIPLKVDSLSQGNHGLHYEVTKPTFTEGTPFDLASQVRLFKVDNASDCSVANAPASDSSFESTPVTSAYSTSSTPTEEFWCFTAIYTPPTYTNEATVTGEVKGETTTSTDSWSVDIEPLDHEEENISFTYSTFRPGETP